MIKEKRVAFLKKILEEYPSTWKTILKQLLSPIGGCFVLHCNFMSIVNSIPSEWRSLAKVPTIISLSAPIPSTPTIKTDTGNLTPISDVSSRQIYQFFLHRRQIPPTAKQKLQDKYSDAMGPLQLTVTWYKIRHAGEQATHLDIQNKATSSEFNLHFLCSGCPSGQLALQQGGFCTM